MISIIIPCYNCAAYVRAHVEKLLAFLKRVGRDFEVILVDDASSDGTPALLYVLAQEPHVRVITLAHNEGKGAAVKAGVLESRGEFVIFTDADLPYDLAAIPQFVAALQEGSDVVLGARTSNGTIAGQQSHRTLLSRLFVFFANRVLRHPVPDTQAGFKGFTKDAAAAIFKELTILRFGFDVEAIAIAQKHGMSVVSVPVVLVNQAASTVRVSRDGLQMILDLIKIFFKYRV